MLKKLLVGFLICILVFNIVGCSSTSSNKKAEENKKVEEDKKVEPIKVVMSQNATTQSSWQKAFEKMASVINEESQGKFNAEVFGGGVLNQGNWKVELEQVQSGSTTLAIESIISLASVVPELFGVNIPFIFDDTEHLIRFLDANPPILQSWLKKLEDENVVVIGLMPRPFRQLINSKVLVKTPKDMKGLKIRVPGMPMFVKTFEALGAKPVPLSASEIYSAIQLGTVAGEDNSIPVVYDFKTYEVAKNMTIWNYIADVSIVFANKDFWNKLSDSDKEIFIKGLEEAKKVNKSSDEELTIIARKEMEASGVKFYEMTNEEKQAFADMMEPVYEEFGKTVGEDNLKKFLSEVDKYR